jgi:hypothetical protein
MRLLAVFIVLMLLAAVEAQAASQGVTVSATATVISKNNCRFQSGPGTITFTLNPFNAVDTTAQDSTSITVRCTGSGDPASFLISDDGGQNGNIIPGQKQLMATITGVPHYIPYSMSYSPSSAPKNTIIPLTVSATILGSSYVNAAYSLTPYADTVTLTITP